jgi:glycosyltransferase involved in cell wall biosynthesis
MIGPQIPSSDPIVSVVMSVFNDQVYLRQAIESILCQEEPPDEFIVVADGSPEDTISILKEYSGRQISVVLQEKIGLAAALNLGIQLSRGRYVARQDADDISSPLRLLRQRAFLDANPEVGLVGCNVEFIDEVGRPLCQSRLPSDDTRIRQALQDIEVGSPFFHGAVMYRRDLVVDVGSYRTEFRYAQDRDLWLRLGERSRLCNLEEVLYQWRLRRDSLGSRHSERQRDYAVLAIRCAEYRRRGLPEPPLCLDSVPRPVSRKILCWIRSFNQDAEFELNRAKGALETGKPSGIESQILRAIAKSPFNPYAWLLLILAMLPSGLGSATIKGIRRIYWGIRGK